jgi:hypothetical protein
MNLDILLISESQRNEGNRFRVPNKLIIRHLQEYTKGAKHSTFFDPLNIETGDVNIKLGHNDRSGLNTAYRSHDKVMLKFYIDKIFAVPSILIAGGLNFKSLGGVAIVGRSLSN